MPSYDDLTPEEKNRIIGEKRLTVRIDADGDIVGSEKDVWLGVLNMLDHFPSQTVEIVVRAETALKPNK